MALAILASASTTMAETVIAQLYHNPKFQVYGLALGITVDSRSKVQTLRVASASESRHGKPVHIQVPEAFLAAVRKRADQKYYPPKFKNGKPVEFFIIYWYSPSYPTVPISDLAKPADQQP